jgi:glycosyltransferase involved in cell wall biosynthesis
MRQLDAMIAISEFTRQGFLKHCPVGVRVVDIPNGVELDKYRRKVERPADWPSALKPREYFAFVGRFKHRKGIDVLLRAFEPIAHQTNFHLALAGDGEMRPALEQLAAELRIADRVHFLGMTRSQAKTYLMQNAAAGIVPSRVWEAFGLVAIEFMAAGRPVVVSDLTGIADLVRPGETGYIVPPEDPQRLSERLLSLVANPDKRERMAVHACRGAAAYDWHLIARHHLDLFEELLGKRQRLAA